MKDIFNWGKKRSEQKGEEAVPEPETEGESGPIDREAEQLALRSRGLSIEVPLSRGAEGNLQEAWGRYFYRVLRVNTVRETAPMDADQLLEHISTHLHDVVLEGYQKGLTDGYLEGRLYAEDLLGLADLIENYAKANFSEAQQWIAASIAFNIRQIVDVFGAGNYDVFSSGGGGYSSRGVRIKGFGEDGNSTNTSMVDAL